MKFTVFQNVDVLIVGGPSFLNVHSIKWYLTLLSTGGPAGSYAASVLALEGISVALFESTKFPRYHIGESLLPSVRNYLRFVGAEKKVAEYGFTRKPGGAIRFNQHKQEAYTDFVAIGQENSSWNVVRSEFDELLLNHSRTCGASVFEQTKADSVNFSHSESDRPTSVSWTFTPSTESDAVQGTTSFKYLIDTSGRAGIMSTRYLKNRHFNQSLKNVAVWGYWRNVGSYGVGTPREGAPYFEALLDESGWVWFIPVNNGTTSIGFVRNKEMFDDEGKAKKDTGLLFDPSAVPNPSNSTMIARYISMFYLAPRMIKLITENGSMVEGSVKSASDYSYSAPKYAGPGFRVAGDAGAFIDPFFSSGVHLALTSSLSAAASVAASLRGECSEEEAAKWHTARFSTSYTRFQLVVMSAYKQLRAQNMNVLTDIDEDNYDRAFAFLRPIIQGNADMGVRLYEQELQDSLDFCVKLFSPTSPEEHEKLVANHKIGHELLDLTGPVMGMEDLEKALHVATEAGANDEKENQAATRMVLEKINARRVLHPEYSVNGFESEAMNGFAIRLERGNLGLKKQVA
ncbi:hypothetical protein BDP27DRAFT_1207886 [Rhodocollybia butyracea]|uniref:Halogenase n=1 Tax=Rhodocollybia butyracea TaxID=206335 RepID=A0A9P5QAT7_9AGAR|nr:hypothetical protein BDP27DRAFT_1207886 [Rhodocollybia butyracea]